MPGSERRLSPRVERHDHLEIFDQQSIEPLIGQVMNISEGGMRFICNSGFPAGSEVDLQVNSIKYHAKVLACDERFEGYALRVQFT